MSNAYILGFLCGLAVVALASFVIRRILKKKGCAGCGEYDERQRAIQGRGYKYAYFTLLIAVAAGGLFDTWTGIRWIELFPFAMLCLWISLCVFVTYCVIRDAYISIQSRRKLLVAIFLISGLINTGIAAMEMFHGEGIVTNGCLNLSSANLFTGAASIYIALALCIKALADRRQGEEE